MKPKGFIHTLVLVLVASAMIMPATGCFGDYKGMSRNDDSVFGTTFGGYWGIGLAVGLWVQRAPFWDIDYVDLTVGGELESRVLDVAPNGSGVSYVEERDLTVVLLHDDTNGVVLELAFPGNEAGRYTLPAGELDAPWAAIEVDGKRFSTSTDAQIVLDVKVSGDDVAGSFRGQVAAEDGTLHEVSGSFTATK